MNAVGNVKAICNISVQAVGHRGSDCGQAVTICIAVISCVAVQTIGMLWGSYGLPCNLAALTNSSLYGSVPHSLSVSGSRARRGSDTRDRLSFAPWLSCRHEDV